METEQMTHARGLSDMFRIVGSLLVGLAMSVSCGNRSAGVAAASKQAPSVSVTVPQFDADSAFSYIRTQTEFGPRVPNTTAHRECAGWLADKLRSLGAETVVQDIEVTAFDGTIIRGFNIIGSYRPESGRRIIICSHWDSRPWADNDPDRANHRTPVDAANDGASGVGVILEIARQMQMQLPEIGVDCIFFDAEDWGPGDDWKGEQREDMWGLGTQYWARRMHTEGYNARYAILLDMVGGQNATFYREGYSVRYASGVVDKVWDAAARVGSGRYFPNTGSCYVTDDHVFINTIGKIPAIDIVPYYPDCEQSSFGPTWHTVSDDIEHIDKATLQAVGRTLMYVIYNEK